MDKFVVSARKYRPSTFKSVVGQEHVTSTLQNAIKTGQLAQAFLFCGPRGVGKTTCARILAKTINCEHLTDELEACNECTSCTDFNDGSAMNVFELDAASNNSVDDIRDLIRQVDIPPSLGRYKVYIIDEVHMLSKQAFNAFLKTLEEPPAWAKFILATTEKQQVLPTILSRCQVFDFKRIDNNAIARHLEYVAKSEGIAYEPEAMQLIASKADGGLRDALSLFDQLSNFTRGNLTREACLKSLNMLSVDDYFNLVERLRVGDMAQCLLQLNNILQSGCDGQRFITGMSEHLRNLMVSRDKATITLLDVSDDTRMRFCTQAEQLPLGLLMSMLEVSSDHEYRYRNAVNKKLFLEVCLMKMAMLPSRLAPDNPQNARHC